ncbi:unnamed protein product [Symbiodinium natans]|uniref:Uncharacterized protein n=1 Tax=Symbiodinium natans TaxID=878477 RepID=A0A812K345_9DINO|nr:unnamed protein product [Symbiodinium natans]
MAWLRTMFVWMAYVTTVLLAIPAQAAGDGDEASDVPSPDARKTHLAEALAISAADILDDRETPAEEGFDALSDMLESAVVAESFTYWELAQAVHDVLIQQGYTDATTAPMMTHLSRVAASASGEFLPARGRGRGRSHARGDNGPRPLPTGRAASAAASGRGRPPNTGSRPSRSRSPVASAGAASASTAAGSVGGRRPTHRLGPPQGASAAYPYRYTPEK